MNERKDYRKTIRLNPSLYDQVDRLAKQQNRNFSNFVVTLLKQTVEQQGQELA